MQIIQCEEKSKQIAFDTEVKYISIYTLVQDKIKSNQIKIEYNKTIKDDFCVFDWPYICPDITSFNEPKLLS